MTPSLPPPAAHPVRILFVFARLEAGLDEREVRLLARTLDTMRYRIDVLPCQGVDGLPDRTHRQLESAGVRVDRTAYQLSFEDTVKYLERQAAGYDIVMSCQDVADIYPALERLRHRPPLIEYGARISDALSGPKHFTTRFIAPSETIRAAAALRMPDRPHHARVIPAMMDLASYDASLNSMTRASLGLPRDGLVVGWAGPVNREDQAQTLRIVAGLVRQNHPSARFVVLGHTGTAMSGDENAVPAPTVSAGVTFANARIDTPDLMMALDLFVCLADDVDAAHLIACAGAASLPVVTTAGLASDDLVKDGQSGLLVEPSDAPAIASAIDDLARLPLVRRKLGAALHAQIAATHAPPVVARQWEALFDEVLSGTPAAAPGLFRSFMQGGFECSTHRLRTGRRLDVVASIGHDTHAEADYRQLARAGLRTVRDGLRWHLIEQQPRRFDFSSALPMMKAAQRAGTQVIWDLLHYGWPDDIDIWTPAFVDRFTAFAKATAILWRETTDEIPFWCPVNEISFFAWGGGDVGYLNPFATGRGHELKVQLARASISAMHALRDVDPRARFVHCEPLIAVHHEAARGRPLWEAEGWHQAQFQAFEMIMGRMWPQIGGDPSLLDIVGLNYYTNNQWIHSGPAIDMDHPMYRPLSDLLFEAYGRYGRPIFLSETGVEGDRRAPWLNYVTSEVARARRRGVPVEGICLYPVANHLGWDDDRLCPNGLLSHDMIHGQRRMDPALAAATATAVARFDFGKEAWAHRAGHVAAF